MGHRPAALLPRDDEKDDEKKLAVDVPDIGVLVGRCAALLEMGADTRELRVKERTDDTELREVYVDLLELCRCESCGGVVATVAGPRVTGTASPVDCPPAVLAPLVTDQVTYFLGRDKPVTALLASAAAWCSLAAVDCCEPLSTATVFSALVEPKFALSVLVTCCDRVAVVVGAVAPVVEAVLDVTLDVLESVKPLSASLASVTVGCNVESAFGSTFRAPASIDAPTPATTPFE